MKFMVLNLQEKPHSRCKSLLSVILLAAHAMELGAVWLGIYPVEERMNGMRKLLNMPSQVVPVSLVSIGYPDERLREEDRFKPERVHYQRWMGSAEDKVKKAKKEK